jgi:hypothetical protein
MTRLFLAAGVAALAISAPAAARPGGGQGGGGHDRQTYAAAPRGGGGGQRAQAERRSAPRQMVNFQRSSGPRNGGQRFAAMQQQHQPRAMRVERQARPARMERMAQRPARTERLQTRTAAREQVRANRSHEARMAQRQQVRANHMQVQNRMAERQQVRNNRVQVQNRMAERQQLRNDRLQAQNRLADRAQLRADRQGRAQDMMAQRQQLRADRQIRSVDLRQARNALRADRIVNANAFRESRFAALNSFSPRTRVVAPVEAVRFIGQPVSAVSPFFALNPLPSSVSYLYPDTPDYYYQYGGGYLYQVDRGSNLIAALLPLLAGGYMPGSYLPNYYMNSYAPSYYGLNSFYPASYGAGYGYGYDNLCNRYANGVIYRVDCFSGMIVDVVPTYAGGYGVGQLLPSAYSTYNVPYQYRDLYYDTPENNYYYAPGAIYQYDPGSSMITSVAALLSPGFTVGQPLPMGYSTYNVPYAYRSTYYDTPNAWYRYNNGYIYQVDPATQVVGAIVASILT